MDGKRFQLVLVVLLVSVAFEPVKSITPEQMEKMSKGMRNTCLQKIDTTEELVEGMRRGEFPDDRNLQCYTNCIMKILRSYKNGAIDYNMILKQVDTTMPAAVAPRVKATIRACSKREFDGDPCEVTYKYVKCCYEEDPEIFFFP